MYRIQEVVKCYLFAIYLLVKCYLLRLLFCFSSRCKDLFRAYPWSKKKSDEWLGRIWAKQGSSEHVWFIWKAAGGLGWWQQHNPKKTFKFGNSVSSTETATNCYIMNIESDFATHRMYPAWKTILTIWQNIKAS